MRVGEFSDTFLPVVDGVGRVVSNYARELGELGVDCYVVTPWQNQSEKDSRYRIVDYRSVRVPGLSHYQFGIPLLSPGYRRRIAGIKFDIVHAHSPFFAGREAARIARHQGIPLVGTFHTKYYDDLVQVTHSKLLARLILNNIIGFYERCDEVWAVSEGAARVLKNYGYQGRIEIVENGTDPTDADPQAIAQVTERYGLGQLPVLLFVGQMNWKKNIRRILYSAAALAEQGRTFRLVMAGQGISAKEIQELSSKLGLDQTVVYTGHVSDEKILNALYARADLFIFPSLYDTAGLVVSEAAALGTPSLLVKGSSASGAIKSGFNGLLAVDETEAMAERIAWALDHPFELQAIGQRARETLVKPWGQVMKDVADRYEQLIRSCRSEHGQEK